MTSTCSPLINVPSKLLVIYLDIGDEDGPSISYWIADYSKYEEIIPSNHIKVVNNKSKRWNLEYINSPVNPLLLHPHGFADVVEIHDWYDYLTDYEIMQKQQYMDEMIQIGPSYNNIDLRLITIVPYNRDPIKYVVPLNTPDDKYIQNNIWIFDTSGNETEKQELANRLRQYKVNASYHALLNQYGKFAAYTDVISDEMELEIDF